MSFKVDKYCGQLPLPEITADDHAILSYVPIDDRIATMIGKMTQYKPLPHCTVLLLDVTKVDAGWIKDGPSYFPKYEDMNPSDYKKYINSRRDLLALKVTSPPRINIADDGTVGFLDGRNRYCNLRSWGVKIIPFVIYNDDRELFREFQAHWNECPTCGDLLETTADCSSEPHP